MFTKTIQGAVHVLAGNESLTEANVDELRELTESLMGAGQPMTVFDMSSILILDSSGLELLLDIKDDFKARGGHFKLAAPAPLCRDILHITSVDKEFEIFDLLSDAVGSFVR